VDEEAVLERSARAVGVAEVVEGRAARVDARLERRDHGLAQRLELRPPQRADSPERVDARPPERLVGVDVAHARDALLGEQERLDWLAAAARQRAQRLRGEGGVERLHAEARAEVGVARVDAEQHDPGAEAAHVVEQEPLARVELHAHAHVRTGLLVAGPDEQQVARHAQVHHEVHVVVELEQQVLAAAGDSADPPSGHGRGELLRRSRLAPARVDHVEPLDPPGDEGGRELKADRLDLGELGHLAGSSSRPARRPP
jgi:hypothetical protein